MFLQALLLSSGCGGSSTEAVEERKSSQEAFNEAETAFGSNDYTTAAAKYAEAIEAAGLYPELYDIARAKLIVCLAAQKKFSEAEQELDTLKSQHLDKAVVLAAESYLLSAQGKKSAAKKAFAQARKIRRGIKPFGK
ncbi:MAG: tetratricopeptide repeat protein [Lacipirellulaceae bacterium]